MLRGRDFSPAETRDSSIHVAIVSADLANKLWPGEDAIGRQIRLSDAKRPWWRVIGVAGNVRHMGLDEVVSLQVYVPERAWWEEESDMMVVARTAGDGKRVASAVRAAVRSVDPRQPIATPSTMDEIVDLSTAPRRGGPTPFAFFSPSAAVVPDRVRVLLSDRAAPGDGGRVRSDVGRRDGAHARVWVAGGAGRESVGDPEVGAA